MNMWKDSVDNLSDKSYTKVWSRQSSEHGKLCVDVWSTRHKVKLVVSCRRQRPWRTNHLSRPKGVTGSERIASKATTVCLLHVQAWWICSNPYGTIAGSGFALPRSFSQLQLRHAALRYSTLSRTNLWACTDEADWSQCLWAHLGPWLKFNQGLHDDNCASLTSQRTWTKNTISVQRRWKLRGVGTEGGEYKSGESRLTIQTGHDKS